MNALLLNILN